MAAAESHPGTVLGEGVVVHDGAIVGKQPVLSPRSTASREPLPPAVIGAGTVVAPGRDRVRRRDARRARARRRRRLRPRALRDRRRRRHRPRLAGRERHDGRRPDEDPGLAYVTAYTTVEEDVFIAPCVVTTNDNFMGRTERRHELRKGPTIRRGARVGGGAVLCPGIEIGEEAFVGAGAVVIRDVPARTVVVGNPARVIRDVPDDELLER